MSVERISGEYGINNQYKNVSLGENETDIDIFDYNKTEEKDIADNDILNQQVNNGEGTEGEASFNQGTLLPQELTNYLESLVSGYEEQFASVKENNGWIAKGWDWFKNKTGIGAGSDKVQKQIDDLKKQIEELKKDPSKIKDVYKSVVGNELNEEELNKLINHQVDLSKSEILDSVMKYKQGQKQCTNIISGITSSLAVVGLIAAGVVTAPFTGGMSLAATAGAIGTLTAAGTAAYMVPQVIDGVTEKDGYSFKESMQDIANGVINSAFTAIGIGGGKAVGKAVGKAATKQAEKTLGKVVAAQVGNNTAGLAASEATSLIIGDGIGVGNYLTEVTFNDEVDFSWTDLGKTAAVSTASSLTAGAAAFGTSSLVRPILASGTTASSQIAGRLLSAGITGGSAGMSAAAVGGGTNYLLTCAIKGQEVSFEEWLNASTENMDSAMITGFIGGMAFEAVHLAAGTPKPEGAVKSVKGTNEYGLKFTNYLDKDGNVIATDISASDMAKIYGSQVKNEQGLIQYGSTSSSEGKVYDTARTFRVCYTNIPDVEVISTQDGSEVYNQTQGEYYRADRTIHDWADNTYYIDSGVVNGSNIPNAQPNIVEAEYEVVYDEVQTPVLSGNDINTPQLTQGASVNQENGLVPLQGENSNPQNMDLVVDTTLAQLTLQQAQMANVQAHAAGIQAQSEGAIISANAVNTGMASNMAGGNNVPPAQVNPPQNGVSSNTPVQTQVGEQSGGEDTSPALTQETAEPKLSNPEEIEQNYEFIEEKYSNNDSLSEKLAQIIRSGNHTSLLEELDEIVSKKIGSEGSILPKPNNSRVVELKELGINSYLKSFCNLNDRQFQRAKELIIMNAKISSYSVLKIAQLDDTQYPRAMDLLEKGVNSDDVVKIAQLDDTQYPRAMDLLDKGLKPNDVVKIAQLDDTQYPRAMDLLKRGFYTGDIPQIASLDNKIYQRVIELSDMGVSNRFASIIAQQVDDTEYPKAKTLLANGVSEPNVTYFVTLNDVQYKRVLELKTMSVDDSVIYGLIDLDEYQYQIATQLLVKNVNQSDVVDILMLDDDQFQSAMELIDAGLKNYKSIEVMLYLPDQKKQTFIDFMTENKDKGYYFNAIELQNDAGIELVGTKKFSSFGNESDVETNDEIKTVKTITKKEDGTITRSTSEMQGNKSVNWYYGENRTVFLDKINYSSDIATQTEIVKNENGEPSYILYTKASDELNGAYETTRYDFKDYPEDMDVFEAIKNGTITGGKILSSVSSENGLTQYEENYEYNNSRISKNYIQKVDETGEVKSTEYKYDITDEEGKSLFLMERSWRKNPDGTTTTIINGKTYVASFDDEKMELTITTEEDAPITIDMKSKISNAKDIAAYQKNTFGSKEAMHKAFFEFLKTMPADQLINLSMCTKINIVEDKFSSISIIKKELSTGLNASIISHEMGHAIDKKNETENNTKGIISGNQEVIDIYNEEMREFQLNYPEQAQEIIRYFSQIGGSAGTGLSEFVAETNMLMTSYGADTEYVKTRSEYLVRYFPKTIAKIGELLGYNQVS